jgi:hypothetical protein
MSEATPTRDAIVAALRELGGGATSSEIRAKTGLGKTTVNDNLKALVGNGTLEKYGIPGRYRLVEPVGADALPVTGEWEYKHPGGGDAPLSTPDADETPSGATDAVAPSEPASSGIADVLDFMKGHAPVLPKEDDVSEEATAAKEVARGFCTEPVKRVKGEDDAYPGNVGDVVTIQCGAPIHKEGRSWVHDRTDDDMAAEAATRGETYVVHKATTKAFRPARPPREPKGDAKNVNPHGASYARGELKGKVLQFLRESPDASFKVAKIAEACDAYAGSTAFILKKLVASGEVRQTNEEGKPAEYQAV